MNIESVPVDTIVVGDRHRKDLGSLDALVDSIRERGLLQPIGITTERRLIFGHRRLEATRRINLDTIDARVFQTLDDAVEALKAERDENTCRKDFTPSEAVALGRELEGLERVKADERMRAGKPPAESAEGGETREKVSAGVGMKRTKYAHAKAVVEAAEEDPEQFGELVKEMDKTGKVEPAYRAVQEKKGQKPSRNLPSEQRAEQIRPLAAKGYLSSQIAKKIGLGEKQVRKIAKQYNIELADAIVGRSRKTVDVRRALEAVVYGLEGYTTDLDDLDLTGLNAGDAAAWADSLRESLKSLGRLRKRLQEIVDVN